VLLWIPQTSTATPKWRMRITEEQLIVQQNGHRNNELGQIKTPKPKIFFEKSNGNLFLKQMKILKKYFLKKKE